MANRKDFRISLPNEPGQLARVCEALSARGVNIKSLAGIAATPPVLAIITDNEEDTKEALEELGLTYVQDELLIVRLSNIPGEIATISRKFADAGINIESIYMMREIGEEGEIAITVSDFEKAKKILEL
jgi:hypothetical protein